MAKIVLGIDLGHDTLKLALINGKTVEKVAMVPIPLNLIQDNRVVSEESMGELLKEAMRENGMHCNQAACVLQNENVFTRTIKMPLMTAEQLKVNLPYEFSDFITEEPQKYVYDYAMLPKNDKIKDKQDEQDAEEQDSESMNLMAVAVQKEHLESVGRILKRAGLKLVEAAPTVSAFSNLIRVNGDSGKEYCILDLGYKAIRMHIFKGERYEVTRTLDVGLSVLDDVIAENLNVDVHLAHTYLISDYEGCQKSDYCMSAYDNIATELARALNFYRFSNPDSNLEDVYLVGGGTQNDPLVEVIRQSLDLNTHHARELLSKSKNREGYTTYVQAIGIAQDTKDIDRKRKGKLPVKRVIDLAEVGQKKFDTGKAVIGIAIIIAVAAVFSIFGVAGRYAKLFAAQAAAADTERRLNAAYDTLAGYEVTKEEYAHYTFENMTEEELDQVERADVLKLLDEKVLGKCQMEYWSVSGNVLKVKIVGSTLSEVNDILRGLNESELVSYSTVSTASKEEKTDLQSVTSVTADIEVYLNGRKAGQEQ